VGSGAFVLDGVLVVPVFVEVPLGGADVDITGFRESFVPYLKESSVESSENL
jgi:hypothetical protein